MTKQEFQRPDPNRTLNEDAAMSYAPTGEPAGGDTGQPAHATLMAIDGVEGVGRGQDALGNDAVIVYVRDRAVARRIPREVDGLSVIVEVTGEIRPLPR